MSRRPVNEPLRMLQQLLAFVRLLCRSFIHGNFHQSHLDAGMASWKKMLAQIYDSPEMRKHHLEERGKTSVPTGFACNVGNVGDIELNAVEIYIYI